ncbi:MAG: hypothetical protein L6Q57_02035 [Alphaproteobacteria bacterium]|nr:hypothetical protein [Alphaproteobacteria bacterium]
MNIDLLFTKDGEAGLITSENLVKKVAGAVMDIQTGLMSLEYADMDYLDLNISIDSAFFPMLELCGQIHLGAIKNGHIAQAYQIPLMFQDDPYRLDAMRGVVQPRNPLQAFNSFVKRCTTGQPVHRDDLGNDEAMGCVLGDASPAALQFAPHLARRHAMEIAPRLAPSQAPPSLGLGTSGGGSGGGRIIRGRPEQKEGEDER